MSSTLVLLTATWLAGLDAPPVIVQTGGSCPSGNCGSHVAVGHSGHSCSSCETECDWCKPSLRDRMRGWWKGKSCGCEEKSCDSCNDCDDGCDKPTFFTKLRSKFRSKDCCDPCQSFLSEGTGCDSCNGCREDCCDMDCGCGKKKGIFGRLFGGLSKRAPDGEYSDGWDYVGPPARHYGHHAHGRTMSAPIEEGPKTMPHADQPVNKAPEKKLEKPENKDEKPENKDEKPVDPELKKEPPQLEEAATKPAATPIPSLVLPSLNQVPVNKTPY